MCARLSSHLLTVRPFGLELRAWLLTLAGGPMPQAHLGSLPRDSPELLEGPRFFLAGCWTLAIFARGCRQGQFRPLLSPGL